MSATTVVLYLLILSGRSTQYLIGIGYIGYRVMVTVLVSVLASVFTNTMTNTGNLVLVLVFGMQASDTNHATAGRSEATPVNKL